MATQRQVQEILAIRTQNASSLHKRRRSSIINRMKCLLASALFLTCFIGCADYSAQEQAGLPPTARTSTTPYPTSATQMEIVCRQPDAQKTNVCEAFRYGGGH